MTTWRPRISLCNEVVGGLDWPAQCALAAGLGYDGLEVAPFTLGEEPHRLSQQRRREVRAIAADRGLAITGLHWLLVSPKGLSITTPDEAVQRRTRDVIAGLIDLCADLGGAVLVHGSPEQRRTGGDPVGALRRAAEVFAFAGERAGTVGVRYCVEPLAPQISDLINTFDEAAALVRACQKPALTAMIDTCSAALGESQPVAAVVRGALTSGLVGHVHFNDRNRRAPGQGDDRFAPILRELRDGRYHFDIGVEPFVYEPDGATSAARAIGYIRGLLEGIS